MLKNDALVGAIVYYDGQHNDARMNTAIAITAARLGASVANHCRAVELLKEPADGKGGEPRVCGAICEDVLTGERFPVRARCVINATGPFTDSLRQMDDPKLKASAPPQPVCTWFFLDTTAPTRWVCLIPPRRMDVSSSSCPG